MQNICDKVFKHGPSKICGRQPFKNLNGYGLLIISLQIFKGCLPQILPGPFLNTLSHMLLTAVWTVRKTPEKTRNLSREKKSNWFIPDLASVHDSTCSKYKHSEIGAFQ